MPEAVPPRVFISYSHDSPEHRSRVLKLADQLRVDGIDAMIDQYIQTAPEGWPAWCADQISAADFVLMVCTETYFRRINRMEEPGLGHGVLWEGRMINQYLYDAGSVSAKFVPVLLAAGSDAHVRQFLQNAIRDAETDLLKVLLHYKGPEKLLAWAATKNPEIAWENLYAHKCQSCLRIYKDTKVREVVRKYHQELISDILQAAWIEEEFYPKIIESAGLQVQADFPIDSYSGGVRTEIKMQVEVPYPIGNG